MHKISKLFKIKKKSFGVSLNIVVHSYAYEVLPTYSTQRKLFPLKSNKYLYKKEHSFWYEQFPYRRSLELSNPIKTPEMTIEGAGVGCRS